MTRASTMASLSFGAVRRTPRLFQRAPFAERWVDTISSQDTSQTWERGRGHSYAEHIIHEIGATQLDPTPSNYMKRTWTTTVNPSHCDADACFENQLDRSATRYDAKSHDRGQGVCHKQARAHARTHIDTQTHTHIDTHTLTHTLTHTHTH